MLGPLCKKAEARKYLFSEEKELPGSAQAWMYWVDKHTSERSLPGGRGEWNRMLMEIDAHCHTIVSEKEYAYSSSDEI